MALLRELQPVLDLAQKAICLGQLGGVLVSDVGAVRKGVQPFERVRRPQRFVAPTVDELQQLHGELDVAQPARPALHFPVEQAARGDRSLGARLQIPDLADGVG